MSEVGKNRWKGGRLLAIAGILLITGLLAGRWISNLYVEILWFRTVEYSAVFWRRAFWAWGARVGGGAVVAATIVLNLHYVARTLGRIQIKRRFGDLEISEQLPRSYVRWTVISTAVLLGSWFGASIPPAMGLQLLFLRSAPEWGIIDPILGKDLMFYVVTLPVLGAIITFALVLAFLVFTLCSAGYAATGALQFGRNRVIIDREARVHLSMLVAAFFVFLAFRFWLGRYLMLLDGTSEVQGIFGYTDAYARIPAMRTLTVLSTFAAVGAVWSGLKGRMLPLTAGLIGVIGGGIVVGQLYPSLVQRLRVQPNELERETPFIEHNMRFTRIGFGLDIIERKQFAYSSADSVDWRAAAAQFEGLPMWNSAALLARYNNLRTDKNYYTFLGVSIDRYDGAEGAVPVALAVREIDPTGIPDPNWQNRHLRYPYVAGLGAVASPATTKTPEGRPEMFLSGMPVEFAEGVAPEGLRLSGSLTYIRSRRSPRSQAYVVINPTDPELAATFSASGVEGVDYPRGIQLKSLLSKLALAWYFRDANLLLASELTDNNRLLFRRGVVERVSQITGNLLRFPEAPYPVVYDGHIVWMLDGFTGTRWFPLSRQYDLMPRRPVRYVRNSVKITVDAKTGEVSLYVADTRDPLLKVYQSGFPGLFKPLSAMPEGLQRHLRYPRALMTTQATVLHQYHLETAVEFHRQQDVWDDAAELESGDSPVPYRPEYGIYRLPGDDEPSFLLTTVFVPLGRDNLAGILVARNDPGRYGDLTLYDVPREVIVQGPRQIEALMEQDPTISEQFSLWRQGGSNVWTGHLHVVPVGEALLYIEPVFLAASRGAIPDLQRFVVSDGRRVSMRPTLRAAIADLSRAGRGQRAALDLPSVPEIDSPGDRSEWPAEALDLLDEAERRLRSGDYEGFGSALAELRALLNRLNAAG
ncbi:MAG: UPF0182 family protein [Gemmatimonadota bacterium]|nr:MAG: UPF0182 family protein [Gemmatimonadota bacterium]